MTLPLAGLKIVVTRPRDQAAQLARSIEQAGGVPLLFPLLEIAAVQDSAALHEQISRLDQFDLAIFISPNAVRYGIAAIQDVGAQFIARLDRGNRAINCAPTVSGASNEIDLRPALKIATVGQGSAKALRELGISDTIAPTERFDSEGLLALPQLQKVAGWRVLIFRGDGGRELLGDTLRARGATVEYVACYQRSKPQQDARAWLDAKPDAITVTSSEALGYLWEMLGACPDETTSQSTKLSKNDSQVAGYEQGRRDKVRSALRDTPIFVPHARIAELATQQGWRQVHLTGSGDEGMIAALVEWAEQKGST